MKISLMTIKAATALEAGKLRVISENAIADLNFTLSLALEDAVADSLSRLLSLATLQGEDKIYKNGVTFIVINLEIFSDVKVLAKELLSEKAYAALQEKDYKLERLELVDNPT
jgi:hypothetical protein